MFTIFLSLFSVGNDLRNELTNWGKKESENQMFQSQSNVLMCSPHTWLLAPVVWCNWKSARLLQLPNAYQAHTPPPKKKDQSQKRPHSLSEVEKQYLKLWYLHDSEGSYLRSEMTFCKTGLWTLFFFQEIWAVSSCYQDCSWAIQSLGQMQFRPEDNVSVCSSGDFRLGPER